MVWGIDGMMNGVWNARKASIKAGKGLLVPEYAEDNLDHPRR